MVYWRHQKGKKKKKPEDIWQKKQQFKNLSATEKAVIRGKLILVNAYLNKQENMK